MMGLLLGLLVMKMVLAMLSLLLLEDYRREMTVSIVVCAVSTALVVGDTARSRVVAIDVRRVGGGEEIILDGRLRLRGITKTARTILTGVDVKVGCPVCVVVPGLGQVVAATVRKQVRVTHVAAGRRSNETGQVLVQVCRRRIGQH